MRWRKLIKDNQKNFSRLHMLIDVFVIAASYALAWLIRFQGIFEHSAVQSKTVQEYMFMLIFIIPGYLLLYQAFDLYTPMRMQGRRLVLAGIVKANALGLLIIMFALYNFKELDYSRLTLVSFCVINIVLEWFVRMVIFYILRDMRKKGMNQKQVLLVGYSRAAEEYVDRILQNPQWGYVIRGILDDNVPAGTTYKGVKVIGRIANLMIILPSSRLDEIAITLGLSEYYRLEEIVALCEKSGVHTKFIPDYNNIIPTKPYTEDILGLPVINIRYVPLSNTFNALIKRSMDIAGAIVAIIVSSPVMLVLCMLIKLTSPGPLIYKQERVGLHNQTFRMYKFRSMVTNAEELKKKLAEETGQEDRFIFKMKDDPRITKVGHFIRKTSLDEFPQFYNVLKGDMSLVGPRPALPEEVARYGSLYSARLLVKPGITGPWQVSGRSDLSQEQSEYLDVSYIENWSIAGDLAILAKTVMVIFTGRGSY